MNEWKEIIIGTLEIAPELEVFVNLVGALFLLEIITQVAAFIGGVKR